MLYWNLAPPQCTPENEWKLARPPWPQAKRGKVRITPIVLPTCRSTVCKNTTRRRYSSKRQFHNTQQITDVLKTATNYKV